MKIYIYLIVICIFIGCTNNHIVYNRDSDRLKSIKVYDMNFSYSQIDFKDHYYLDGKEVKKRVYKKHYRKQKKYNKYCPCIQTHYSNDRIKLYKVIGCKDCYMGSYESYYSNGKVKVKGNYIDTLKEFNDTTLVCGVKDGSWLFFEKNGDTLYTELWKNGNFIQQFPEQDSCEIWKLTLKSNERVLNEIDTISKTEFESLKIIPHYKNNNRNCVFTIKISISKIGHREYFKEFNLNELTEKPIRETLNSIDIPLTPFKTTFSIDCRIGEVIYFSYYFYLNNKN